MKQTIKTIIKAIVFTMMFVGIMIFNALLFDYIFDSVEWMIFSFLISLSEIVIFINYVFPIVFKDYIEEFYKKEATKYAQKKSKKINL